MAKPKPLTTAVSPSNYYLKMATYVAEQTLETAHLDHNQLFRFSFPRQPDSAGQRYLLTLSGNPENSMSSLGVQPGCIRGWRRIIKRRSGC